MPPSPGPSPARPSRALKLVGPAGALLAGLALAGLAWLEPTAPPRAGLHGATGAASSAVPAAPASAVARAAPPLHRADFGSATAVSSDARRVADWVAASQDNGARDFIIVDKRAARVFVFDQAARLQAETPALLGSASGDHTVPGIGERPIAQVQPHERTTPAGRFVAEPGVNTNGEDVVWVDYDAAVSMHRVRTGKPAEQRLARLATPGIADNRISYGCINLPVQFYEAQLRPRVHGNGPGAVVYVLPEVLPLRQVFPQLPAGPAG